MVECSRCGATLAPNAPHCPYCGVATAQAHRLEQEASRAAAQREATVAAAQLAAANASIQSTSNYALAWSLLGLACCFPASIVAVVMGARARAIATKHHLVVPARASAGLALGVLGLVLGCGCGTWFVRDQHRLEARREALERELAGSSSAPVLDGATACALAEARLLTDGFEGTGPISIEGFECSGVVEQRGELARLDEVSFKPGSKPRVSAVTCLARGAGTRWRVTALGPGVVCDPAWTPAGGSSGAAFPKAVP